MALGVCDAYIQGREIGFVHEQANFIRGEIGASANGEVNCMLESLKSISTETGGDSDSESETADWFAP